MELHTDPATGGPLVLLGQFGRQLHPADPPVPAIPGATRIQEMELCPAHRQSNALANW